MKVLIEIDEGFYEIAKEYKEKGVRLQPPDMAIANGTPLNGTNGDVIKSVFPNLLIIENRFVMEWRENGEFLTTFDGKDWWNADYKGVE